ncbi:MAG: hypothetical protein ACYCVV_11120 [Acidimicrobiales bacterium]
MDPLRVTLNRAKETKNTVRYEETTGSEPPIVGTLYLQKWAAHRPEDPEVITVTIEAAAGSTQSAPPA